MMVTILARETICRGDTTAQLRASVPASFGFSDDSRGQRSSGIISAKNLISNKLEPSTKEKVAHCIVDDLHRMQMEMHRTSIIPMQD